MRGAKRGASSLQRWPYGRPVVTTKSRAEAFHGVTRPSVVRSVRRASAEPQ